MFMPIGGGLIMGAFFFAIGIGLDKLHDKIWVRKRIDGEFDRRFLRGSALGFISKGFGVFIFVLSVMAVFIDTKL